jgi:hypothetical protein
MKMEAHSSIEPSLELSIELQCGQSGINPATRYQFSMGPLLDELSVV